MWPINLVSNSDPQFPLSLKKYFLKFVRIDSLYFFEMCVRIDSLYIFEMCVRMDSLYFVEMCFRIDSLKGRIFVELEYSFLIDCPLKSYGVHLLRFREQNSLIAH